MNNFENIIEFIKSTSDLALLKDKLKDLHNYELAKLINKLDNEDREKIYSIYTNEEIGEILTYIDTDDAIELIENLNDEQIASIINTMEPDDAVDIINELEDDKKETIINLLDDEQKYFVSELVTYDENTAGSIMNSNYISIKIGSDIKKLMKEIVSRAPDVESINTSFVIDEQGKLLGTINLKTAIITKSPKTVDEIMNTNIISAVTTDSLESVINQIKKYDIYELPVLENGILKGIITMDDAIDVFYEESEDDYIKFAAVSESTVLEDEVILAVKSRLPWLALLLILDIFIALVISRYDYLFKIEALTILIIFQPLILDMAGNVGTQALAVTIRQITNNELNTRRKIFKQINKELFIGLITGITVSLASIVVTYIILLFNKSYTLGLNELIFTVAVSMFASIIGSNFFGTVIPIILYKIKIDPAAASGPLITTIMDIVAVIIYYTLATVLLYNQII